MTSATIAEIAQQLGLSKFSVAVALRNKPGATRSRRSAPAFLANSVERHAGASMD